MTHALTGYRQQPKQTQMHGTAITTFGVDTADNYYEGTAYIHMDRHGELQISAIEIAEHCDTPDMTMKEFDQLVYKQNETQFLEAIEYGGW